MIKRVRIKNFRSIEDCEFFPSKCCALIGENSAGKTNVLSALKAVLEKDWHRVTDFAPEDVTDGDRDRDVLVEVEFDPPPSHEAFKNTDPVPVPILRFLLTRYKVNTDRAEKGDLRLEGTPLSAKGKPIQVLAKPPKRGEAPVFKPLTSIPSDLKSQVPVIYVSSDRRLLSQLPTSRYSLLRRLFEDIDERIKRRPVPGGDDQMTIAELFASKVREAVQVLRVPEFVELEELLRRHSLENLGWDPDTDKDRFALRFGLQDSLDFFKAIRLLVKDGTFDADATQLGDGAQNAVVIAIFQAYEALRKEGAVFLIEEPEMYLHPHKCKLFYDTLRRISETNQVIYTTHSPYFVAIPQYEEIRTVRRAVGGRTEMVSSALAPTPQLREKLRKEFDPERNELFFAKHVILVEGDTEKLALAEYAQRLAVPLHRLGISIVEVGGKRSLEAFSEVILSFELPLTVVFDTDSSDFERNQKEQEEEYNQRLRTLAESGVAVVEVSPKYEEALRNSLGDALYTKLCNRYPGVSKAVRARLIAADPEAPVPDFASRILTPLLPPAPTAAAT